MQGFKDVKTYHMVGKWSLQNTDNLWLRWKYYHKMHLFKREWIVFQGRPLWPSKIASFLRGLLLKESNFFQVKRNSYFRELILSSWSGLLVKKQIRTGNEDSYFIEMRNII